MSRPYCAVLLLCSLSSAVWSQTTFASITGTVTDSTGAAVPNATVTATNVQTNIRTVTVSNEVGNYNIAQLLQGTYTVRAQAAGFREFAAQNVVLASRDIRRVDVVLEVGAVETVVEVSAGATLIETETARIGDVKSADVLKSLPLNTRGIWAFLALSPNVLQSSSGSTIRFAGSRGNQSQWAIDGTSMSDGVDNTQIGPLANYIESFQEMKLDMSNNTAEFGTIGQVTLISKSGTNDLHGNLFDYYSTPWFRARNPFSPARPSGVGHTPGGSVGGPVAIPGVYNGRNKTFFFYSFETSRGSAVSQTLNPTVPIAAWRAGDFSALLPGTAIYDPLTGQPFPENRIPANRINAVSQKIQERFYPLPNFGNPNVFTSQNYREEKLRPRDPSTYWIARIDHRFSDKDSIYGRYTRHWAFNRTYEGNLPTIGRRYQRRANEASTVSYTHVFKPTVINEFRWGFALNNNPVEGPIQGRELVEELGLVGLAPDLPDISGILQVSWTGLGLQNITQPNYTRPGFRNHLQDLQNHVSWFRSRHNLKFGFNLTRVAWDDYTANASLFGNVNFSSRFTGAGQSGQGHPYADFLLGIPTTATRAFPPVMVNRNRWQYDFYVVDDFKVNSRLTVNLGLRYELHQPWREDADRVAQFDLATASIVIPDGASSKVSPIFPHAYVPVIEASQAGLPGRTLLHTDKNNLVPRVGVAYRPFGQNTVFRAGWGMFYDVVPRNLNMGGLPFVLNEPSYTNPTGNPDVIFPRVFPGTGSGGPSTVGIPAAVNPDLKIPYSMQYNFTIEHQRWDTGFRVSYIGTNTRHGDWSYNYNAPVPDERLYVDKPRPFPQYPAISYFTNGAGHQYHGMTVEVERAMAKGLYFQSSWTWARDIGDLDRGQSPENPFDRRRERAVVADIPTHRVTTNWLYQFPFGRGRTFLSGVNRLANLAVGGWELSGIYSIHSGHFLTPLWTGPDPVGVAQTGSRTPPVVTLRPDQTGNPNLPKDQRLVNRWFDASAFTGPQPGRYGTAAKGTIKGPGVNVWHMGLHKNFEFSERARFRWELTATNVFNHPNWSNPVTNITSTGTVGVISGVGGVNGASTGDQPGARSFRMGFRVEW